MELPVGGGLRPPLSLYFMAVAKSGARKSTAEKKANRGAADWQKAAMKSYRVELRAYKTAVKDHEAGRKSAGKNGDGFHEPEPVEPVSPRLLVSDATAVSVVKLLGGNNRPSIGLFTGEGGKFTSGYAMSDKAKGYSAAVFNTLWDDGSADRNRATDEIGSIKHDRAARLPAGGDRRALSLLAREQGTPSLGRGSDRGREELHHGGPHPGGPRLVDGNADRRRDAGAQVLFAGIQSVYDKAAAIGHASLLLIDEAHLVPPKSGSMYRRFIDELLSINPKLKVVGFTATPYRSSIIPKRGLPGFRLK